MTGRRAVAALSRADYLTALALAVALFAIYAAGAARTIYVGDSGELVTAVHVLGVPHPTGYPLYLLLGKLWTLLVPVGSIAFRMSLFSAAGAALAAGALFLLGRRLALGALPALTAALCFALAPSFWGEANVQRVYALNALCLSAALLCAVAWIEQRTARRFALTVFVAALGATNHTYMGVFLAGFGIVALLVDARAVLRPRTLALAAAAAGLGLLPYAYLPIAAAFAPPLVWGDPQTLDGFLDILLRRDFWYRAWVESPADVLTVLADWVRSLGRELGWLGVPLAVVGAVAAARRQPAVLLLLALATFGNVGVMALHGSREDLFVWHRYYIPSYLCAALLAGFGAQALTGRAHPALRVLPLAVPLVLLVSGWSTFDRSRYRIADEVARRVLADLPPGTVLHAADDNVLFPLLYLTLVEQYRPDVSVVLHGSLPLPAAAGYDPRTAPVAFTHQPALEDPGLAVVPAGLVFHLWRADLPPPHISLPPETPPAADDPSVPRDYQTRHLIAHYHFMLAVTLEAIDWPRAADHVRRAAEAAPDSDVMLFNLALLYLRNGQQDEAIALLEQSVAVNPRELSSGSGLRVADVLAQLRAAE